MDTSTGAIILAWSSGALITGGAFLLPYLVAEARRVLARRRPPQSARIGDPDVDTERPTEPAPAPVVRDDERPRALGGTLPSAPWGELWTGRVGGVERTGM